MKKRILLLPIFIIFLISLISAPSTITHVSFDDNYNNNYNNNNKPNKVETTRSFFIIEDDGNRYHRTFESLNKNREHDRVRYKSSSQRNIYRDFFDVGNSFTTRNKEFFDLTAIEKDCNCPVGWICKKD